MRPQRSRRQELIVDFPLPMDGRYVVAAAAPAAAPGNWAGASSAALAADGSLLVAYRVRTPDQRGASLVLATVDDSGRLTTIGRLDKERFGAESLERPALIHAGGSWRLYVSCATPRSKHWRIDVIEAADPAQLLDGARRTVFAGSDRMGVKDPVIRRTDGGWQAWICCHPLDQVGEEDRMETALAASDDGLEWKWHGTALSGRAGSWDARGARVTAVLADGRASYDGRATKDENFSERTGLALPTDRPGELAAAGDAPVSDARYLDVVERPGGGFYLFFEMPRPDGSHDLCFERIDPNPWVGYPEMTQARPADEPVTCFSCGARVPSMSGPVHRYMLAAPGCWNLYGRLLASRAPRTQLTVDGYAVQHHGVPGPQANQSVCVHLLNLCRVLEHSGGLSDSATFLASLAHRDYPWLTPPPARYPLTVADLLTSTEASRFPAVEVEYARGVWEAWSTHHPTIKKWLAEPANLPPRRR